MYDNDEIELNAKADDHPHQGAFFMGNNKNLRRRKIDWHDYRYMEYERNRAGIGGKYKCIFAFTKSLF